MSDQVLERPRDRVMVHSRRKISAGLVARYAVLAVTILVTVFPLIWLFITSIRTSSDIFAVPVHIIPDSVTMAQYVKVFSQYDTGSYLWNTVVVSLVTVVFVTVLSLPCAYAAAARATCLPAGAPPTKLAFLIVLKKLRACGQLSDIIRVHELLNTRGTAPDVLLLNALLYAYGQHRHAAGVHAVARQLRKRVSSPPWWVPSVRCTSESSRHSNSGRAW